MKRLCVLLLLLLTASARAEGPYPSSSIYNMNVVLTDQAGVQHGLDVHKGHPVLITLFYGSCPMACPLLIDTLRAIEHASGAEQQRQLRVIMVSIDPQRDTVQNLQLLARNRRLDSSRWTLARTDAASVRKIAALLNVQYRQLPDGDYNHSSVISLLTPQGEIALQSSVLNEADDQLLDALRNLSAQADR